MFVKKPIPSLCKLWSFYEEVPEDFLDDADVDSYFYRNIFDVSQSQHRKVRVSKVTNKKSFAIKLFQFYDIKTQQRYVHQQKRKLSKRELSSLVYSLRQFIQSS